MSKKRTTLKMSPKERSAMNCVKNVVISSTYFPPVSKDTFHSEEHQFSANDTYSVTSQCKLDSFHLGQKEKK